MTEVPKTMRAAVYRGVKDVRVETIPVPEIGPGEVLVKIHTCGICGTDLKKIHTGSHSSPRVFGHEMAGRIVAIGDGVTKYAVGDRVMAYHHIPCGECFYCRKHTFAQCETYKKVGCTAGFEPSGGGFAEYIRVMDWIVRKGLVKIPDGVPFEQDGWRDGEHLRERMTELFTTGLAKRGTPWRLLTGTHDERLAQAIAAVREVLVEHFRFALPKQAR
jgi:hypothetical protein